MRALFAQGCRVAKGIQNNKSIAIDLIKSIAIICLSRNNMSDLGMKKRIDQHASGLRNQAVLEMTRAALTGLIMRHPEGDIDADELAKDAVAIAKATIGELMLERIL